MPYAARKPCTQVGCRAIQPCPEHARKAWGSNQGKPKRLGESKRTAARKRLFALDPLCSECRRKGRFSVATIRDHVIPLAEGGKEVESNTQGLCEPCHRSKTAEESRRGRYG